MESKACTDSESRNERLKGIHDQLAYCTSSACKALTLSKVVETSNEGADLSLQLRTKHSSNTLTTQSKMSHLKSVEDCTREVVTDKSKTWRPIILEVAMKLWTL